MFNLSLKVWDTHKKEFLYWGKIKTSRNPYYAFSNKDGTNKIGWSAVENPKRYTLCFGLGQKDKHGTELFSGDIVVNEASEIGTIVWQPHYARFAVKSKGKPVLVETAKIEKVGDVFHTPASTIKESE